LGAPIVFPITILYPTKVPFSSLPSKLQVLSFIYFASYFASVSMSQLGHSQISDSTVCLYASSVTDIERGRFWSFWFY